VDISHASVVFRGRVDYDDDGIFVQRTAVIFKVGGFSTLEIEPWTMSRWNREASKLLMPSITAAGNI
jgi:hypothetical protein